MIIAVLDTNVLASGFIGLTKPDSTPGELLRRWRAKAFLLVVSEPILAELADTFTDPYFTQRLSPAEIEDALASLRSDAVLQPISAQVAGIAAHPADDLILATALSARSPFLVPGDKPLLERGRLQGTQLLSPRHLLTVLASQPPQ